MQSNLHSRRTHRHTDRHGHDESARAADSAPTAERVPTDELLSVLEDDCGRRLLEQVAGEAKPARTLVEAVDASRATVYRRLNALENVGLVETGTQYDENGHHRKVFRATLDRVTLELDDGGLSTTIATQSPDG